MPGEPPKPIHTPPTTGSGQRRPEVSSNVAQPAISLSGLENDLETARAEYAARRYESVERMLQEIQRRISVLLESNPPDLEAACRFVEASLLTLQGRLVSHTDHVSSLGLFRKAAALFQQNESAIETQKSSTRIWTDWGIALHRIGDVDKSVEYLTRVCSRGAAPAEAYGYLGYGKLTQNDPDAAAEELSKGLEIAPSDYTMSFYYARALEMRSANPAKPVGPAEAATQRLDAAHAYSRAAEIAMNLEEYSNAGRCGLRALRIEPGHEHALNITVDAYRRLGRPKLALLALDNFLKVREPHPPAALASRGVLLRDLGQFKESVDLLRSIPVDSPELAWVRAELAQSLLAADPTSLEEPIQLAREAAALAPRDTFVLRVLALLQIDANDHEGAASTLTALRQLGDTSEVVSLDLAQMLMLGGKYSEAEAELKAIIEANPRSADAYVGLGFCAEKSGNPERALWHYRKASRIAPEDGGIFAALMSVMESEPLRAQAMDEIEDRLSGPLRHLALWYKGRFEMEDQDWVNGLQSLEDAVAAAEEANAGEHLPGILVDYGDALRQAGQYEHASKTYQRAYAIDPTRQDVLFAKALCHCDVAQFAEAEGVLDQALQSAPPDPSHAPLWDLRGWCRQHRGNPQGALDAYQKAFDLSEPKNAWYRKGLANILIHFNPTKARDYFAEILEEQKYQDGPEPVNERSSTNTDTIGLLGWCNYRLERYDEAIRLFKTALARSSQEISVCFDLGLSFLASGRTQLAEEAYLEGHKMTEKGELLRRRGLYYVALFDLVDAGRCGVLGPDASPILDRMKQWLSASGVPLDTLPWLPADVS